jgi:hypothetical protein
MMAHTFAWCAICQYKDKKEFYFGTVFCEDSYQEALVKLEELWYEVFPYEIPKRFDPLRGILSFNAGD